MKIDIDVSHIPSYHGLVDFGVREWALIEEYESKSIFSKRHENMVLY